MQKAARQAQRDGETRGLPSIWLTEARFMLDMGVQQWRRLWDAVYQYAVLHHQHVQGIKVNLASLIKAVHPDLKNDARGRALFANAFLWKLKEERGRIRRAATERRLLKGVTVNGIIKTADYRELITELPHFR